MSSKTDVFIAGSGSAGLSAATWLARLGIPFRIVDSRSGPLEVGQADGVQCRTVEIFESLGISEELLREGHHVLEVAFWNAGDDGGIVRTRRAADTERGLSHLPHVILNQARVNGLLIGAMVRAGGEAVGVEYGFQVKGVEIEEALSTDLDAYPVSVKMEKDGNEEIVRAKYVLACDGAHSAIRKSLGIKMIGDSTDHIWGVMDIYPITDFPDIRRKVVLQSSGGSIVIIPREGGSLCRFYIELPEGTSAKDVNLDALQESARKIFYPYKLDFADTFWWSAYSIGQRLAERFSQNDRVFLTGDACHTHSPKAGQGMNVSLQDGYDIGWKLAMVLNGRASPDLLKTYTFERETVAANLINFDRTFAEAMSSKSAKKGVDFSEVFVQAGRYTAGLTTKYEDSVLTRAEWSKQDLAPRMKIGMRFPSAQVVRHCDAKAMQLAKSLPSDGRWRIVVFAGDINSEVGAKRLREFAKFMTSDASPVKRFTPAGADIDSFIETILVLSDGMAKVEQNQIPDYFWPVTGKWKMRDLHKTFVDDESYNSGHGHAYEFYGVEPAEGAVVVVRPDQYISMVIGVEDHDAIGRFFGGFVIPQ